MASDADGFGDFMHESGISSVLAMEIHGSVLLWWHDADANFSANGSAVFIWKLHFHWLKGLQWSQIPVVIQGIAVFH